MAKDFLTSEEIINYIATSKKTTPVKVYVKGDLSNIDLPESVKAFGSEGSRVLFTDLNTWKEVLANNRDKIVDYVVENDRKNSAIPLLDLSDVNATKIQVQEMVKMILNLKEVPKPDDVADALAVAITHGSSIKFKESFRLI